MNFRTLLVVLLASFLISCSSNSDGSTDLASSSVDIADPLLLASTPLNNDMFPVDIADRFQIATVPLNSVEPEDVISGTAEINFTPFVPPAEIYRYRQENWLKTTLLPGEELAGADIIEIPGHLFNIVDIWFQLSDGKIVHDDAGRFYPYAEREVKHSGVAFKIPKNRGKAINIFVRMHVGVPVNFAALLWSQEAWDSYVFNQRLWYGIFLGAILVLLVYNTFFAVMLRDLSYLFYVGYILSLTSVVLLYCGLLDEYLWRDGINRIYVLMLAGIAIFFGVGFVNTFLNIRRYSAPLFWITTAISAFALLFGALRALRIYIVPHEVTGVMMHVLLLLGSFYFISVSLVSYIKGVKQARFLALSMVPLMAGMIVYFLYTYGVTRYNLYTIHAIELGSFLEGIILSLALADRINLLSQAKEKAERRALDAQRFFSKRLLRAQEADREIFSNAMHDSIGHGLLVLKQNLEKIASTFSPYTNEDKHSAEAVISQADYCAEILSDVRGISHDLHPHLLKRLGLKAAIESTLERAFINSNTEWHTDIGALPEKIEKEKEITIYRVFQECVNNILKHAVASEVMVSMKYLNDNIVVSIKDDGAGIDLHQDSSNSLGLQGIKERIQLFGGVFTLQSVEGIGTQINFKLPIS